MSVSLPLIPGPHFTHLGRERAVLAVLTAALKLNPTVQGARPPTVAPVSGIRARAEVGGTAQPGGPVAGSRKLEAWELGCSPLPRPAVRGRAWPLGQTHVASRQLCRVTSGKSFCLSEVSSLPMKQRI